MFENLQEQLRQLSMSQKVIVPLESDVEGYVDKECPIDNCLFQFKIHGEEWKGIVQRDRVFCPSCRHDAPAKSWYTTAQIYAAKEYALGTVKNSLRSAMLLDANASKRRGKQSNFLNITLDVRGGGEVVLLPVAAAEPMRLRTKCDDCGCRYSYVGAAYFCPSCGKNSAVHTFLQTLNSVRTSTKLGEALRGLLEPDEAEVTIRTLLEKAILDIVTSFQRLAEQLYEAKTGKEPRRNVFQNLDAGSLLWETEFGTSYIKSLEADTIALLRICYQQRHLLAHQQGIVDKDYIVRSGDKSYKEGQRIIIDESFVLDFASAIERIGARLISQSFD